MNELPNYTQLKDLIGQETSPGQFESIVGELLSEADVEVIGGGTKEIAVRFASNAILSSSTFLPSPQTFGKEDFRAVCCTFGESFLPTSVVDGLVNLCVGIGVFSVEAGERFVVEDPQLQTTLRHVFQRYD